MTATERDELIRGYFENECMAILAKKGHDYAGNADCFGNLRRFGLFGIIVRLSDKFSRIETLAKAGFDKAQVKDESIRDTLRDIVNYALLAMIFLDGKGGDRPGLVPPEKKNPVYCRAIETFTVPTKCLSCRYHVPKSSPENQFSHCRVPLDDCPYGDKS